MKTGKYTILEILEFKNLDQLVVPEIQRDYVWEVTDVLDLLESIKDGFEGEKADIPYLGFIYAYTDKDYVYKYFLVDGQQRMTSVYLLLLACHQKISKKLPVYLVKHDKLKLDYKVRQATHDFLSDLVNHCRKSQDGYDFKIEDQIWYHKDYENDRTICNMIHNYVSIKDWLNRFDQEQEANFIKFVEDKVALSYFDIENGREGEELYIYMNSRGRQLEANETLKATFLGKLEREEDKLEWGKKWEDWQDFFWKQRGKNPDADAGFNEFLRRIQIINMCALGNTQDEISSFASGRGDQKLDIALLPLRLNEIDDYFQSFKWIVESERVSAFFELYESKEFLTTTPEAERRQIYYLRILPVLALLARTGLKDEEVVVRFIRFFYNVARKLNVRKDIAGQLPIAVKLMLEYSNSKKGEYDVSDLIAFQKGRTVLIDEEEVLKLCLYKMPSAWATRRELEELFWEAEDHKIFDGEIKFLLDKYYNKELQILDVYSYKRTWSAFMSLFPSRSTGNYSLISRALLYYGNTWIRVSPFYYYNYNCQGWYELVRIEAGKNLLALLEDMHGRPTDYLDIIIKNKIKEYFTKNEYFSIVKLKEEDSLLGQVRVLAAIDFYSERRFWQNGRYIAEEVRYTYKDKSFFNKDRVIFNVGRYIGNGLSGRVIPMMQSTLHDEVKLNQILTNILNFQ